MMINRVNVRLNDGEGQLLHMYCERHKVNVSDAIRSLIFFIKTDHQIETEAHEKQLDELKIVARQKAMKLMEMGD